MLDRPRRGPRAVSLAAHARLFRAPAHPAVRAHRGRLLSCARSAHARSRSAYDPATVAAARYGERARQGGSGAAQRRRGCSMSSYDAQRIQQASASLAGAQATHRERSRHAAARRVVAVRVVRAHDPRSAGDRGGRRHADAPPGRALRLGDAGMRGRREFRQHRHAGQARRDDPLIRACGRRRHASISIGPWPEVEAALKALPGFGPWTRAYLAIRLGRDPDAFPETDLGLIRAAQVDSPAQLLALADAWRPYRAYAATYLWAVSENQRTRSV